VSWTDELYKIYEYNSDRDFDENEPVMLPVAHSTIDVHLEVTVSEDGELRDISVVPKEDKTTVRPNTGKAKTGKTPPPFPLTESIKYLAGDFVKYKPADTDKKSFGDNSYFYNAYLEIMKDWNNSKYSHKAVNAILLYISKGELISDFLQKGVLETDENNFLKPKQYGVDVDKITVRFIVNYNDLTLETRTWKDKTLFESFLRYNTQSRGNEQLCYALGKELPSQYIHPAQILKGAINAKLFSFKEEGTFKYTGRFFSKEEATSLSYEFSEKMHNALKWLIEKQSITFRTIKKDDKTLEIKSIDSMTVIVWASAMQNIPDFTRSFINEDEIEEQPVEEHDDSFFNDLPDEDDANIPSTQSEYKKLLKKRIVGIGTVLKPNSKVMVMGLDSANPGRINISMYSELEASQYLANIEKWHSETAWLRFYSKPKKKMINSFSASDIIRYAFGTEQGASVECDKKVMRDNILRLLSCITNGAKLPSDIVNALYQKASNPLAYEHNYNHRSVLETACGMIRKKIIDEKGDVSMAFDPNITDRSYLFGCLLAVADKAESESYDDQERNVRVTNARRYWNAFSQRPYQTWGIIEERLRPYMDKLGNAQVKYSKWINEIVSKMDADTFSDNSRLEPLYLLGYHQFTDYMYNGKAIKEEE
jgi:CRISPR-associated protein Csd1